MDKLKQWVALTLVAVLAVGVAGWVVLISPRRSEAADLRRQAVDVTRSDADLRTQLQVLKAQAAALPKEQAALAQVALKVPGTPAQPDLLRALQGVARSAGVELVSIAPGAPTAVAPTAAAGRGGSSAGTLQAMPVQLTIAGGFYQAQQFIAGLEDLPRALRLTNIAIADGADPTQVVPAGTTVDVEDGRHLTLTLTGTVYVASGAAPLTPVTAPAAPATK